MAYATISDLEARCGHSVDETVCTALLEDSAVMIDAYNEDATESAKKIVSCRMVIRAIGSFGDGMPIGATQGSMSGLGYSQSWTMSNGSTGELYLSKADKKVLGVGNRIGSHSVLEDLCEV